MLLPAALLPAALFPASAAPQAAVPITLADTSKAAPSFFTTLFFIDTLLKFILTLYSSYCQTTYEISLKESINDQDRDGT